MQIRPLIRACAAAVALLALATQLAAQSGVAFSGRLINSLSGDPVAGATLQLDELRLQATSAEDGSFTFATVPPGTYHLSVTSQGYSSRRIEVVVGAAAAPAMDVVVDPELHFQEVTTVSAEARSQFDAFQPVAVLSGQELTQELGSSLGATLEGQPGVSSRGVGPGSSRPVVRGLDGDRVQILQDGQRMGDLSSQSGDHGVTVNPAAARRVEVVRGPATLLYGTNAIGGLINVITDEIPTRPVAGSSGNFTFDLGSAAKDAGGAGHFQAGNGRFAFTAGGGGRRSDDVRTPIGEVANSQSRNGFGNVGFGVTGERAYLGASYGYDDNRYGIPVVEGGILQLTPRRHSVSVRAGAQNLTGVLEAVRASVAVRRYKHDELEGDEIGTAFTNNTADAEMMVSHRAFGRFKGSAGGWFLTRGFNAVGAEALSPAVDQRGYAAFGYEEVTWPHVTLQFGGRVDHTRYEPLGEPTRAFTNGSGSVGLLLRPANADDRLTIAASLARASRAPALEELFFFGLHHGNFAIELGNPGLQPEQALGFDLSLRWRSPRASGEVTYFRNDIADFIFRNELDHDAFDARLEEFEARFPGRALVGHAHREGEGGGEEDVAIVDFVSADAVLQGVEVHADFAVTPRVFVDATLDVIRGSLSDGTALPRIPPARATAGLRYQDGGFQVGGTVTGAAKQDRVSGSAQPTGGYTLLKLFASYSFEAGGAVNTLTARLDNATDRLYRNHLSLIKDVVPEMGRNFKLLYNVTF